MTIDKELLEKVKKATMTEYCFYNNVGFTEKEVFISDATATGMIEDLLYEIGMLDEKIEDIEQDIHDNYKRIEVKDQLGDL